MAAWAALIIFGAHISGCLHSIHVLESDDFFGVFEWGAGGIVHIHFLRWLSGRGRYDHVGGAVPGQRRRRDTCDLAAGHLAELAEWGLQCPEKFQRREWDEDLPTRRSGEPLQTDDVSDGSGSESAGSDCSEDPRAEATQALGDDEQWARVPGGCRLDGDQENMVKEEVPSADVDHLKSVETLLQDSTRHPGTLPLHAKR